MDAEKLEFKHHDGGVIDSLECYCAAMVSDDEALRELMGYHGARCIRVVALPEPGKSEG